MLKSSSTTREAPWSPRAAGLVFLLSVLVFSVLEALAYPGHLGVGWDEATDLAIVDDLHATPYGYVVGSDRDRQNSRLPHALVDLFGSLTGWRSLLRARHSSLLVSLVTLVGVFVLGRRLRSRCVGAIACALLATSPYFLAFSRTALTEGDVFITCALTWCAVAFHDLLRERSLRRVVVAGVLLGIAIACKVSALALLPVLLGVVWVADAPREASGRRLAVGLGCGLVVAVLLALLVHAYARATNGGLHEGPSDPRGLALRYGLFAAVLLATVVVALARGRHGVPRLFAAPFAAVLAALVYLGVPPMHLTNPDLLAFHLARFTEGGGGIDLAFTLENTAMHAVIVLLKPSLGVGLLILGGLVVALCDWRRRERRVPLAILAAYFAFVVLLPYAQTFYMLPLFPLLALLASDTLCGILEQHRRAGLGVLAVIGVSLGVDHWLTYPDWQLNGYQWTGARYLAGRATLHYRGIAQTPSDGIEQSLAWVEENARPGSTVTTFVMPPHILAAGLTRGRFRVVPGLRRPRSIERADYVVTSINATIEPLDPEDGDSSIFRHPYDPDELARDFERVFAVRRAFGIEVAAVWRRRER